MARMTDDRYAENGRGSGPTLLPVEAEALEELPIVVLCCFKVVEMLNGLRRHLQGGRRRAGQ